MEESYLSQTIALMNKWDIPIRDTWKPDLNLDDYYINGYTFDGPRHFEILLNQKVKRPQMDAERAYSVPGYESKAYNAYKILIPDYYTNSDRTDHIIHECVHFLQHTTSEEEKRYIDFDGTNYGKYISQRAEYEAHIVQIDYIITYCEWYVDQVITTEEKPILNIMLGQLRETQKKELGILIIKNCKAKGLI